MEPIILQPERTLDQALLGGMKTFLNGCNFRLLFDRPNDQIYLELGCYGVHLNLCQGDEYLLLRWLNCSGKDKALVPIHPKTAAELTARKPCNRCGGFRFIPHEIVEIEQ